MKILRRIVLGFFIVSLQAPAMEQLQQSKRDGQSALCSSGRHLRRGSWPRTTSDQCTEAVYHNIHELCMAKASQTYLRQAGMKVVENNQEEQEEE